MRYIYIIIVLFPIILSGQITPDQIQPSTKTKYTDSLRVMVDTGTYYDHVNMLNPGYVMDSLRLVALNDNDTSRTNEGSLTVGAGTSTTSLIQSNTSGSTAVTLQAGNGIGLSESSNTITITNAAAPDTSIYTYNGTLTGNRAVTMGSYSLNFDANTLVIDGANDRVGIGTTTPGTLGATSFSGVGLHVTNGVQGRIVAEGSSQAEVLLRDAGASVDQRIKTIIGDGGKLFFGAVDDNGTQRKHFTIDNNGNVGIGTSAPSERLHVSGGNVRFSNYGAGTVTGTPTYIPLFDTNGKIIEGTLADYQDKNIYEDNGTLTGNRAVTMGSYSLNFDANTFFISGLNNYVGIGTSTPDIPLFTIGAGAGIGGTAYRVAAFTQDQTNYRGIYLGYDTGGQIGVVSAGGAEGQIAFRRYSSSWKESARIDNNGNLGIGTTTPASKLDVEGGVSIGANYSGTTAAPTNGAIIEGNVGIGTTTPASKLDVEGGVSIGATYSGTTAAPTNGAIIEGNVGIGTTTPSEKLHVSGGNVRFSSYGAGLITGTPTYDLVVDTNGKLIERALPLLTEVDGSITNEGSLTVGAGTASTSLIQSNTSGSTAVTLSATGLITLAEAGSTITIGATEVDGSITNEGSLTVGAGTSTTSLIQSNTSGSTPVTIQVAGTLSIAEDGDTITLTGLNGNNIYNSNGSLTFGRELTMAGNYLDFIGSTNTIRMASTGLFGVGITPLYDLHVKKSSGIYAAYFQGANPAIALDNVGGLGRQTYISFRSNGASQFQLIADPQLLDVPNFTFYDVINATHRLYLKTDGTVGFGTNSPTAGIDLFSGQMRLRSYGGGTYSGTATRLIASDVNGYIIELPTNTYLTSEVDGSTTNEIQGFTGAGTWSGSGYSGGYADLSDTASDLFLTSGTGITVATQLVGANTYMKITNTGVITEVDGSVTNEAQSLTSSGTTSFTSTLSTAGGAGGGSLTIAAGSGITVTRSSNTATIAATGGSSEWTNSGGSPNAIYPNSTSTNVVIGKATVLGGYDLEVEGESYLKGSIEGGNDLYLGVASGQDADISLDGDFGSDGKSIQNNGSAAIWRYNTSFAQLYSTATIFPSTTATKVNFLGDITQNGSMTSSTSSDWIEINSSSNIIAEYEGFVQNSDATNSDGLIVSIYRDRSGAETLMCGQTMLIYKESSFNINITCPILSSSINSGDRILVKLSDGNTATDVAVFYSKLTVIHY